MLPVDLIDSFLFLLQWLKVLCMQVLHKSHHLFSILIDRAQKRLLSYKLSISFSLAKFLVEVQGHSLLCRRNLRQVNNPILVTGQCSYHSYCGIKNINERRFLHKCLINLLEVFYGILKQLWKSLTNSIVPEATN